MTAEDMQQLERIAPTLRRFKKIGVFSPWKQAEGRLFPGLEALPRWRWDLNNPGKRRFDVLVACNVFMMSPDPAKWFRHALASCKYFLIIDLIRRRRSESTEFGTDGDTTRYSIGDERPRIADFYDLNQLRDRIVGFHTYNGGANPFDEFPRHFIALIRGDLAEPVVRLDDYPTGIRPILDDMAPLHSIIEKFEYQSIPYYLGIVPALVKPHMLIFLRGLQYVRPAVHGYDHSYPKYAPILQSSGDIYNERSVGAFNEFSGQSLAEIRSKLTWCREFISNEFGSSADVYIPPCNRGDRKTGRILEEVGFKYYMSEKSIPFCRLPRLKSDFYGRSNEYDFESRPDVITLHTTWEWDVQRKGDTKSLDRLMDYLAARFHESRELTERLSTIFPSRTAAA